MAIGLVFTVVQTLLATLRCDELRRICSRFKYESELEALQNSVDTINNILADVESKHQNLTNQHRSLIEKLKDVVYDADDLFDELTTKAQKLRRIPGGRISKKVRRFFSGENQFLFAFNKSGEIKELRKKLDGIARDHSLFDISDVSTPIIREESFFYAGEECIIGRETDVEAIVKMLLSDPEKKVSFVTILGMGGLGKTALAKLIYENSRIKDEFELLMWVFVSEKTNIMKEILLKILGHDSNDLVLQVKGIIQGKRYLLVLDDLWCENRQDWADLTNFLALGGQGSRVLVTTRSLRVANVIGDNQIHELKGLSTDQSWDLFTRMAFKQGKAPDDAHLIRIGKEITQKCANVPLSIKVIGSLLCGQQISQWLWFTKMDLAEMIQVSPDEDRIMPTLMFSYYHLSSSALKSCFSICSLFPKNSLIKKDVLISMWLAHGFLVPPNEAQSMEDVGDKYFSILLHRCFFQDLTVDKFGKVHSFRIHDLMHDLARKVAGKESLKLSASASADLPKIKIRHLSSTDNESLDNNWISLSRCPIEKLRTFSNLGEYTWDLPQNLFKFISRSIRLRVLNLQYFQFRTLPDTIGTLLHLRYLDLTDNVNLEMLPTSITKLHNLQILRLAECRNLKELPKDTSKLVNLRVLDIDGCVGLTHMPPGMDNLTCLHKLTMFVVRGDDYAEQVQKGELKDLEALVNLRGDLNIVQYASKANMPNFVETARILRKVDQTSLEIRCDTYPYDKYHDIGLESLCSHNPDISKIVMKGDGLDSSQSIKFPSWAPVMASSFVMLVSIELLDFFCLQHLPSSLSQLGHLKYLRLVNLKKVEYIESDAPSGVFWPSLEKLELTNMPLKGWWRDLTWKWIEGCRWMVDGTGSRVVIPSFPCLRDLSIADCMRMEYFPHCPYVKYMNLKGINNGLTFCTKGGLLSSPATCTTIASSSTSSNVPVSCNLEKLNVSTIYVFNSLCMEFMQGAIDVQIDRSHGYSEANLRTTWLDGITSREGFLKCASSLLHLSIEFLYGESIEGLGIELLTNLKTLKIYSQTTICLEGAGFEHLTNLQSLEIAYCKNLVLTEEDEPWIHLRSLSSLKLVGQMLRLPKGLQHLTSLRSLYIACCDNLEEFGECLVSLRSLHSVHLRGCNLKTLPDDMCHLTSIQYLHIEKCYQLEALGEWIGSLRSLRSLRMEWCLGVKSLPEAMRHLSSLTTLEMIHISGQLKKRCRQPHGEDWPKICRIPNLCIQ